MDKQDILNFDVITPAKFMSSVNVEAIFGKLYKYDFPKWCNENELHCFYNPPTLMYLVFPKSLKEL